MSERPAPAMEDESLLRIIGQDLAHLDGLRDRVNALDKPARGSRGATSAKRYLGHLHTAFARHALSSAIDHMDGWRTARA